MFNTQHMLYMVISGLLTGMLLQLANRLKEQKSRDRFLLFFALATVAIHYSDLWVDFFANNGQANIASVHILPVYPCNVMMWLLLAAALIKDKTSIGFQLLSECCFYVGMVCGVVGIVFNANFGANPTLADYGVLKGLLSHSTMLVGCLFMLSGGYVQIRLFNVASVAAGLAVFSLCGVVVDGLYVMNGMEPPDGMFLRSNPYFEGSVVWPALLVLTIMYLVLWLRQRRLKKTEETRDHYA